MAIVVPWIAVAVDEVDATADASLEVCVRAAHTGIENVQVNARSRGGGGVNAVEMRMWRVLIDAVKAPEVVAETLTHGDNAQVRVCRRHRLNAIAAHHLRRAGRCAAADGTRLALEVPRGIGCGSLVSVARARVRVHDGRHGGVDRNESWIFPQVSWRFSVFFSCWCSSSRGHGKVEPSTICRIRDDASEIAFLVDELWRFSLDFRFSSSSSSC
mmetsp:Transcript_517/g.1248  ORF Transcript_517/g.1248 Transcript_517/m.1248 type:complete len:214 (+) Transcript_517:2063-2704(+)